MTKFETVTLTPNPRFWSMIESAHKQRKTTSNPHQIMNEYWVHGFDPGETTGYARWDPTIQAFILSQLPTPDIITGFKAISGQLTSPQSNSVAVVEDYKVYGWKADDHKWAGLHTPQLIGATKVAIWKAQMPIHFQMAQEAKAWATDEKLQSWDLYSRGMRHARDASRHIITYLFFNIGKETLQS
jgi:hypothetical protein